MSSHTPSLAPEVRSFTIFQRDPPGKKSTSCTASSCGTGASDRGIAYGYNLACMLTSEGDGAGGTNTYQRSPAGEITWITDASSSDLIVPGSVPFSLIAQAGHRFTVTARRDREPM